MSCFYCANVDVGERGMHLCEDDPLQQRSMPHPQLRPERTLPSQSTQTFYITAQTTFRVEATSLTAAIDEVDIFNPDPHDPVYQVVMVKSMEKPSGPTIHKCEILGASRSHAWPS